MRIAIVSDIHGNRTAFEAVLADLQQTVPDIVFHGGDLADGGSSPAWIIDRIRDLGWAGVGGNTDEMLFRPDSLAEFASLQLPKLQPLFDALGEMAEAVREALGEERLDWLRRLPPVQRQGPMALVHASPASAWRCPVPEAGEEELRATYAELDQAVAVYAHIHHGYVRRMSGLTVVNTGSVSLSYDGDPRAAYLLLEDTEPSIRRVEYDIGREQRALYESGLPHAEWVAKILENGSFSMP